MSDDINQKSIEAKVEEEIKLKNQMKSGLNWFYWIAALSIINSVLFFTNKNLSFVAGLGITQIIDAIFNEIASVHYIGIIINAVFIIGFILLGRFSQKSNFLIILGIVIYSLDSLIFIFAKDLFSFGFHIFAIVGIIFGLKAKSALSKINKNKIEINDSKNAEEN